MDSAHTLSAGQTEGQAGGLAMGGCPGAGAQWVNLWAELTAPVQLDVTLAFSLFDHELDHVMGWQHHWPCADASGPDISNCNPILPVYLFGWTDNDGDGVAEILDPAPYGLVTP